ncbi:peptidase [Bacillus badius]|uniref:peptidase n=1 Tax=Bacillus badius TaxID=1455 RepID=UPI002E1F2702|nr:peptidase [Bacillus badius]MED0666428.1 peptidase [Bacillus badius]
MERVVKEWMRANQQQAIDFLKEIVQEPSVQGKEIGAQKKVANKLNQMGLEVDIWEPGGEEFIKHPYFCATRTDFAGSPNVVGVWRGTGGGKSLILNGHIDVVPAGDETQWFHDPFSGKVTDGKMYGRGVTDMKGGNVSLLFAIECLKQLGIKLKGDVIFQSVIEEESGGGGTLSAILRGYRADAAIIPEPTDMKIFPKQQGSMWFKIRVKGRSAHGGTRYEGISAIEKSMIVIEEIQRLEKKRNERVTDPLYQNIPIPIPINIGVIQGGDWPSSVPDQVELQGRMGVAPEENMEQAKKEMEEALNHLSHLDDWFSEPPQLEWFGAQWVPGTIDPEHLLMNQIISKFRQVMKCEPMVEASPWGTDGGLLNKVGEVPSIVFGPGITGMAHYPNEYIELDKMIACAEVIALTILEWCEVSG